MIRHCSRKLSIENNIFINFHSLKRKWSLITTPKLYSYFHNNFYENNNGSKSACYKNKSLLKGVCIINEKKFSNLTKNKMVRILNVAEKNDAAKNLAEILSRGGYNRRDGFSPYNKIYEFGMVLQGQQSQMVMTSVSGHLLTHSFTGNYKKWYGCNPLDLFDAPVVKICPENMTLVKRTLEAEARGVNRLIIWTDCDREGENIGYEIISVCRAINPNMLIQRAKFSEITFQSVNRAIQNLGPPDERQNNAVEVRSELDLRIGAAFTRFQTLRLQKVFPQVLAQTLISYGSCQFPTLGFVVERYKAIEEFIPEQFWKIKVSHEVEDCVVLFHWRRVRLFDQLACQVLHDKCMETPQATVRSVKSRMKSKWRPMPLDTIELEKLSSRKLKLNAKETMKIAEKLYTSGYISYPRTETNIFPKELDLRPLVQMQTADPNWGEFAMRVATSGPTPRQGKKSDQAHPPIHPTKYANNLQGNDQRVYEFIVRHFLACCDKDAKGTETVVDIEIAGEEFTASGLIILERNYLDVYPYEKWSDKEMPHYEENQLFEPTSIEFVDGQTSPPPLLTEADLISLMEKHGIGTDATHADHIETIKSRLYVGLQDSHFVPGELGMGLVEGYDSMGFEMSKPNLRSELEADLKRICEGVKDPAVVLKEQVDKYRHVFREAMKQASKIDVALGKFLNEAPQTPADVAIPDVPQMNADVMKCPSCGSEVVIKSKRDNKGLYLSCQGYPECKVCMWFPEAVKQAEVLDEKCSECVGSPRKIKFTFTPRAYSPILPTEYVTCIGGCDSMFMETLSLRPLPSAPRGNQRSVNNTMHDSGYSSNNSFTPTNSTQTRLVVTGRNTSQPQIGLSTNRASTNSLTSSQPARNGFASTFTPAPLVRNNSSNNNNNNNNNNSNNNNNNRGGFQPSNKKTLTNNPPESFNLQPPINRNNFAQPFNLPTPVNRNNFNQTTSNQPVNRNSFSQPSSQPASRNNFPQNNGTNESWNDEGNDIVCNCNENAIKLTVRKEGPNTGRQFYKCSQPQGQGCNFFLWADDNEDKSNNTGGTNSTFHNDAFGGGNSSAGRGRWGSSFGSSVENSSQSQSTTFNSFGGNNDDNSDAVTCNCGIEAKRLTTMKEGANKGREFYVCPKIREEQCGYFQWVDELGVANDDNDGSGRGQWRGRGRGGRGGGASRGQNRGARGGQKRKTTDDEPSQKRKCGLCGEMGHNRRNCPYT